jgi:hypothetical protein
MMHFLEFKGFVDSSEQRFTFFERQMFDVEAIYGVEIRLSANLKLEQFARDPLSAK